MDQLPAWLGNEGFVRMLEGTTYIVSIIGVPVAIVLYARSLLAEKHAREWAIYQSVQEKYMNFLDTALSRPKVGVLWTEPDVLKGELSADERIDQDLLFNILTSIFERAFLVYRRASSAQRRRQWAGWESFIEAYARRRNFREWWRSYAESPVITNQYDLGFERYLNEKIDRAQGPFASAPPPVSQAGKGVPAALAAE